MTPYSGYAYVDGILEARYWFWERLLGSYAEPLWTVTVFLTALALIWLAIATVRAGMFSAINALLLTTGALVLLTVLRDLLPALYVMSREDTTYGGLWTAVDSYENVFFMHLLAAPLVFIVSVLVRYFALGIIHEASDGLKRGFNRDAFNSREGWL